MEGALGREVHGWHPLRQVLQSFYWNAPFAVDDPRGNNGVFDSGEQPHELVEVSRFDAKFSVARILRDSIQSYLDSGGTICVY